jgi:ribose transport system permease protein
VSPEQTTLTDREAGDAVASPAAQGGGDRRLSRLVADAPPWTGVAIVLVAMLIGLSVTQDVFLTWLNINNILRGAAITLLLAIGSTFLLTTGMIDLSIGSMLALATMILAGLMSLDVPVPIAVLGVILSGALLGGAVNGMLIAKAKLSFFVVTLGTLALFRSAAEIPTQGLAVELSERKGFAFVDWIGDGKIGPLSVPVVIAALALIAAIVVSRYTNFGRALYAVGGNERAARLAGIPVDRVRIAAFTINGALVGLAAVIFAGRIQSASPLIGAGIELNVIAAVLLGGTSFLGGAGSMAGTLLGVLFIAVLQNGLNLLGVEVFWQGAITGVVLILAVWADRVRSRS